MQIGKRFLIIGLMILFAFQATLVLGNYFRSATLQTPFGWQDEGYVLGPALKVYEEGWKSYRCRGDQIICYGAVHTFFDVLVLRALPESWVKDAPLLQPLGPGWFYQAKYPNAFVALRTFRVVLGALLLGFIGILAAKTFRSKSIGILWALALPCFETFRSSRMGLKNDFSFSLYLILFLVLANGALKGENPRRSRFLFVMGIIAGVIGISVKFGIILPLALLVPAYLGSSLTRGLKVSTLISDLVFAGIGAGFAFLLTNPAAGISLGEANWFSSFLAATGRIPTSMELKTEFLEVLLPNLWPFPFLLFLLYKSIRRWDRKELIRWIYLLGVPIVWAFLTWKSAYHRSAYYLPILVWIFIIGIWTPKKNTAVVFLISCLLAIQATMSISSERNLWTSLGQQPKSTFLNEPWQIFQCQMQSCKNDRWVIDRTVRAAVPKSVGEENVLYFDSLVDSPRDVERLIKLKWPDRGAIDPRMLITCWQSPPTLPSDPAEYYSPAAEVWSKILKDKCVRTHPINANAAFAFENGWRPTEFSVLSVKDLHEEIYPLTLSRDALSPRMLTGSWQGIDSWYAPVILKSNAILEGEFLFREGLTEVVLPVESTCKGTGQIELDLAGKHVALSADTRAVVCEKRSWVCRTGLEDWWTERVRLEPISLRINIPRGGQARIRITVTGGDPDRCRISLGTIRFTGIPQGKKVEE